MSYIKKELLLADILDAKIKNKREDSREVLDIFESMVEKQSNIDAVEVTRCKNCKYGRPIDNTRSPEKYFKHDCVVCECEDVVGDESMIYPPSHFCSYGKERGKNEQSTS